MQRSLRRTQHSSVLSEYLSGNQLCIKYCHMCEVTADGVGFITEFIGLSHVQLVTT
jgi:hypothetical protein